MEISFIGLGKLGLPVATLFASKGYIVHGYENDPAKAISYRAGESNLYEPDLDSLLKVVLHDEKLFIHNNYDDDLCNSEIIFIAVPTPSLADDSFDTHYIKDLLVDINPYLKKSNVEYPVIALISTVLPGTFDNEFKSILDGLGTSYGFCYNAQFIAMGSVIEDMLNPEFVLVGAYDERSGDTLFEFYDSIIDDNLPVVITHIINAEIIKCVYNNFISLKIAYANTIMEMCDKLDNANCDVVSTVLSMSNKRLLSSKYLSGGLADGGACHPRDNRALSYLSKQLDLAANPFEFVSQARVDQTDWLADKIVELSQQYNLSVKILGMTFKSETNLIDDSPSLLLGNLLSTKGIHVDYYDPVVCQWTLGIEKIPTLYVIGTAWESLREYPFVAGSVIVDPSGFLTKPVPDCEIVAVGRHQ